MDFVFSYISFSAVLSCTFKIYEFLVPFYGRIRIRTIQFRIHIIDSCSYLIIFFKNSSAGIFIIVGACSAWYWTTDGSSLVQVQLFNQILNHYVLFFEDGNDLITIHMINEVSNELFLIFNFYCGIGYRCLPWKVQCVKFFFRLWQQ